MDKKLATISSLFYIVGQLSDREDLNKKLWNSADLGGMMLWSSKNDTREHYPCLHKKAKWKKRKEKLWSIWRFAGEKQSIFQRNKRQVCKKTRSDCKGSDFMKTSTDQLLMHPVLRKYWSLTRKSMECRTWHSPIKTHTYICREESFLCFLERRKTKSIKIFSLSQANSRKQMLLRVQEQNSTRQNSLFWTTFHSLLLTYGLLLKEGSPPKLTSSSVSLNSIF